MKIFFNPDPVIITTGGGGPGLFQDTIENMKNAISLGSDVIRTNVSITKDNKIVLFSNAVFKDKRIAEKGIPSFTHNDLKTLYRDSIHGQAGTENQDDLEGIFPELEQTLSAIGDHRFNLHFSEKIPELNKRCCEIIGDVKAEDRILVSSLNGFNLNYLRGVFPDIPTSFSFGETVMLYALYRTGLIFFRKHFNNDALVTHEMIGASFLANAGLIKDARSRGIRVYVLNVMKEDQVIRLYKAGVDGFVTNYVSLVKRALIPLQKDHDS